MIIKKNRNVFKIGIFFIILGVTLGLFYCVGKYMFGQETKSGLTDYEQRRLEFSNSEEILPNLKDLPDYKDIYYEYRIVRYFPFFAETMLLAIEYDDVTYKLEKEQLNARKYLDHVIVFNSKDYIIPAYDFSINSFYFRILELKEDSHYDYPKEMGFVATSDEKKVIVYLYFYDPDIDLIGIYGNKTAKESMINFIKSHYKYDW